jgi:hypothetical protein
MTHADLRHMSPHVVTFIKQYMYAAKRDFDVFGSMAQLMARGGLEVECAVRAARLSLELQEEQFIFDETIAELAEKNKNRIRGKLQPAVMSEEALTQLVSISFFKVIDASGPPSPDSDKGWFSGHPADWRTVLQPGTLSMLAPKHNMWMGHNSFMSMLGAMFNIGPDAQNQVGVSMTAVDYTAAFTDDEPEDADDDDEDDDQ